MASSASTQDTELDALFRSHRLDNILPDAFALGAVPTVPTGHLADLYKFLACDPPAPVVLPTNLSLFFHNELQNNCLPLNTPDSKLLARIFKNSYRPDNESLRALALLDTSTTDHVFLYNTVNHTVTSAVEQLAIGLTQQLGLTTFTRTVPNTDCYPTLCSQRQQTEPLTHVVEERDESPPPCSVSPPVRRAQSTPRQSTEKGRKTRASRPPTVEPSPSNAQQAKKKRTSKTSLRAEILPEDEVPVSIHTLRGVNKTLLRVRRKSSAQPSSQTVDSDSVRSPQEKQSESGQVEVANGATGSPSDEHISENDMGPLAEIGGNDATQNGSKNGRALSEDEHHNTVDKTRVCNSKISSNENKPTFDKENIDDAMVEDEFYEMDEDNNTPMDGDRNDKAQTDVNDDTDMVSSIETPDSDMTPMASAGTTPSKSSDDVDNATATSPADMDNITPIRVPLLRSSKRKASDSVPSTDDTPSTITRRSARHQGRATPGSATSRYECMTPLSSSNIPGKYKCAVEGCGKVYNRSENADRHYREKHANMKPYPCPLEGCGKTFVRSDKLTLHINGNSHRKALKKKKVT